MKCVEMCDSVAITEKPQSQWLNTLESLFLILIKSSGQSQWAGGSPLVTGNRVGKGAASAILWLCYFLTWWLRLLHWAVEEETVNLLFMGGWSAGIHWDPLLALSHMVTQWGAKRWRSNHVCGQESVWRKALCISKHWATGAGHQDCSARHVNCPFSSVLVSVVHACTP